MSTHPSSPGQVAARKIAEQWSLSYLPEAKVAAVIDSVLDSTSFPAAGEEWTANGLSVSDGESSFLFACATDANALAAVAIHNATLRRSQPVEDKCRKCGANLGWLEPGLCDNCRSQPVQVESLSEPTYTCVDCGKSINEGEFKTFGVCDECWEKTYTKYSQNSSQPVQGLEQIAREADSELIRLQLRAYGAEEGESYGIILRACQAAASQAIP